MKIENFKSQEKRQLKINHVILLISFIVITIAVAVSFLMTPMKLMVLGIILAATWLFYVLLFFYVSASFHRYSYCMTDKGLYIHQGVFWRKKIVVPKNRVQHTDVTQGPVARKYDLAELIVHTAGTRNASVKVVGILHSDAEELRASLSFDEGEDTV